MLKKLYFFTTLCLSPVDSLAESLTKKWKISLNHMFHKYSASLVRSFTKWSKSYPFQRFEDNDDVLEFPPPSTLSTNNPGSRLWSIFSFWSRSMQLSTSPKHSLITTSTFSDHFAKQHLEQAATSLSYKRSPCLCLVSIEMRTRLLNRVTSVEQHVFASLTTSTKLRSVPASTRLGTRCSTQLSQMLFWIQRKGDIELLRHAPTAG